MKMRNKFYNHKYYTINSTIVVLNLLLLKVAERIDDIRRLSASRRDALQKMASKESRKPPVQVVSPEKLQRNVSTISVTSVAKLSPTKVCQKIAHCVHFSISTFFFLSDTLYILYIYISFRYLA